MKASKSWRLVSLVMVVVMLLALMPGFTSAEKPADPPPPFKDSEKAPDPDVTPGPARKIEQRRPGQGVKTDLIDQYLAKLDPTLREAAQTAKSDVSFQAGKGKVAEVTQTPIEVLVYATPFDEKKPAESGTQTLYEQFKGLFVDGTFKARPALGKTAFQIQVFGGEVLPQNLLKLASMSKVQQIVRVVLEENAKPDIRPDDDPTPAKQPGPEDWAKLRDDAAKLREGSLPWDQAKAYGDGRQRPTPQDWFEVSPEGPHKAESAWARGYDGEGVTVAVLDDGIDFGHPDLMGTQKIYSSTVNSQYNGWPMAFSAFSMYLYWSNPAYAAVGQPGMSYADTSEIATLSPCGSGISCFSYTPFIAFGTPGFTHNYVIADSMSKSGVVHVGTHPDFTLRDYTWGEMVAIIVCDPNIAGVYDTVYVDLDDDYDFRDEKPLTKADTTSEATLAATMNNPVCYRDLSVPPDGIADLSGGAVIFVADGVNPIPVSGWLYGGLTPTNGDLVCFTGGQFGSGIYDSHGTLCGSAVAAQGVVNGLIPSFRDLPPGPGQPAAAIYGGAPKAKLVDVSDIYWNHTSSSIDSYLFVAVGYDGIDQTGFDLYTGTGGHTDTDTILACSNSYGNSATDNDGWEYRGQLVSQLQRNWAPYAQYLFSTGNGAPGYGTVAPPSPATGIAVGASTQYGSTGWDTITDTNQIMFNDVAWYSNRGPSARDGAGVDVVAGGQRAAGAVNLNYNNNYWGVLDGNLSWETWGGTSRSAPIALGNLALLYQAYKDQHGTWPTYDVAKALFMGTSTDVDHDVLVQGAGSVNADRGTLVASGEYGVYITDPSWEPGDFRGTDWPGFAHVVFPGDTWNKTFTVTNDSASAITVALDDGTPQLIGSEEFTFTITDEMFNAKSPDNFFKAPQWIIPITGTNAQLSANPWWGNIDIPADADLMIVRMRYPYSQYDVDDDYAWDNRFRMAIYNWKDIDGDHVVWTDKDGNGDVNFVSTNIRNAIDMTWTDGDIDWDDPITEVDQWEYGRFDYTRPGGNILEEWVRDPVGRMLDGLFIGLQQYEASTVTHTDMTFRIDFYKYQDIPWLSTNVTNLVVPAGGAATFQGTVNVPANMPPGDYEAAIKVYDPGDMTYDAHTTVIPVVINVAADFAPGLTLGGAQSVAYDQDQIYNNGLVRGYFDWTWRAESGDWRFFYLDLDNAPIVSVTYLSESFDSGIPGTWTVVDNDGGGLVWQSSTVCSYANETGGLGVFADANSDCFGTSSFDTELRTPVIDLSAATDPVLEFKSAYENYANNDSARVWASGDGGTSWDLLLDWNVDQSGPQTIQLPLIAYAGSANVIISFQYDSNSTSGWYWYWQVDDVVVAESPTTPYAPGTMAFVKDVWDDVAPYTDIDTVILGPTASSMGSGYYDGPEPSFYGPYVLDTVASSPNNNIGGGTWRFGTSTGGSEDWVAFPIDDGLFEILQHNVLFEGDKFEVPFTKTLGVLWEDVHEFELWTCADQGTVGTVTITPSMELNGLVAEGYGMGSLLDLTNEPVDFVSNTTIEWSFDFPIQDGFSIDVECHSPDISDIDLYVFFWNGTAWEQRGSSTTGSADEYITILNPEDGDWRVGINNWSGPSGHFDLHMEVVQGTGISVSGATTNPIPANTGHEVTISYDYPMEGGLDYYGLVVLGPPEAPNMKRVPIYIHRVPVSAYIDKEVDHEVAFPGNELEYTINLYNLYDAAANFQFTDPIPANTEYVSATMGCIWLPMWEEDFDSVAAPALPAGWGVVDVSGTAGNWATNAGTVHPSGGGTHSGANLAYFNSWTASAGSSTRLYRTTGLDLSTYSDALLTFWMFHESGYTNNDQVQAQVSTDGGTIWNDVGAPVSRPVGSGWLQHAVDLSAYTGPGMTDVRVGFLGISAYGNDCHIDDVAVQMSDCPTITYDSGNNEISWSGTLPLGSAFMPPATEGFEDGVMPPPGWEVNNIDYTNGWLIVDAATYPNWVHGGNYAALAYWTDVDIRLYSTWIDVPATNNDLSFWGYSATENSGGPIDGHLVTVHVMPEGGGDTVIWDLQAEETWYDFGYRQVTKSLAAYAGQRVRLAWYYEEAASYDNKGVFVLDDVELGGDPVLVTDPSVTVWLTVRVTDTVASGTTITNTANLEATHDSAVCDSTEFVSASATSTVAAGPNLSTSYKEATIQVEPGDEIVYQVHVINSGDELVNVTLTDTIPASTTYSWHDTTPPYQHFEYNAVADQMEWTGNIAPDEEWVFTFAVDADSGLSDGDAIANTATIAWDGYTMNLPATTQIVQPDVVVTKSGPAAADPGDTITYIITYANEGTADAWNVVVSDTLPTGVTSGSGLVWNVGNVTVGMTGTIEFTATLDAGLVYGTLLTNTVEVVCSNAESDTSNNEDELVTMVVGQYQIYLPITMKE